MEYIALEEAFDLPELAARRADAGSGVRMQKSFTSEMLGRLPDFTEHRLPDMDEYNVAVQLLSLTVPGMQYPGLSLREAIDDARFANDHLASGIAKHPDRFRGFAALPTQDPAQRLSRSARPFVQVEADGRHA